MDAVEKQPQDLVPDTSAQAEPMEMDEAETKPHDLVPDTSAQVQPMEVDADTPAKIEPMEVDTATSQRAYRGSLYEKKVTAWGTDLTWQDIAELFRDAVDDDAIDIYQLCAFATKADLTDAFPTHKKLYGESFFIFQILLGIGSQKSFHQTTKATFNSN